MTAPQARRNTGRVMLLLASASVLVWRCATIPPAQLWRDWTVVVVLYGVWSSFKRESDAWPMVTTSVMAYLLAIYVLGHLPYALSALGLAP